MASLSPEYQEKLEAFQKLSTDIRALVSRHQQFEAQLNENSMVKEVSAAKRGCNGVTCAPTFGTRSAQMLPEPPRAPAPIQELDNVKDEQSVFKMHGKVLIRQDIAEARSTVNSRIKLIQTEM